MRKNVMSSLMLLLALCSISSGCVDPMIVDEIQMVSALGYDAADDGQLKITTAVPLYLPSKEVQTETYTAIVPILKSTPKFINAESSQPFVVGKIEVVLISSELAEQGVNSLIDSLSRDPYVGAQIYVAIVQGETQALLEKNWDRMITAVTCRACSNMPSKRSGFRIRTFIVFYTPIMPTDWIPSFRSFN